MLSVGSHHSLSRRNTMTTATTCSISSVGSTTNSDDDDECSTSSISFPKMMTSTSVPFGHVDYYNNNNNNNNHHDTIHLLDKDGVSSLQRRRGSFSNSVASSSSNANPNSTTTTTTPNGELMVTIASALLLFCHFGITLYKIETDHPATSIGKQHLKDRWALINVCIFVFALASHLYRQALSNLQIKFAPIVLVPDLCTTGVVVLILTKHIYFALYLLMAGVTFLSLTVSLCDLYAYCYPNKTIAGSSSGTYAKLLSPVRNPKKEEDEAMMLDTSLRSVTSIGSSASVTSIHSATTTTTSSTSAVANWSRNLVNIRNSFVNTTSSVVTSAVAAIQSVPVPSLSSKSSSSSSSSDHSGNNKTGSGGVRKKATRSILRTPHHKSSGGRTSYL